jgi:hypothetical protein
LTTKILKSNGQTVYRLTLRHLNNEEIHCPIHQEMSRVFNETVTHHLGPNATEQDFSVENLTPDYDFYDDDHDLDPDHGDLEVIPIGGQPSMQRFLSHRGELWQRVRHFPEKG